MYEGTEIKGGNVVTRGSFVKYFVSFRKVVKGGVAEIIQASV